MAYVHDSRDLTPVMTANNAPSPIVVSASSEYTTYLAWKAFDHTGGNSTWATGNAPSVSVPQWLKIYFGSGNVQYVGAYAISEDTLSGSASTPKDWTFEGSSNGVDWTILDTRSNEVIANWSASAGTLRYFNCQKTGLFEYYRLNCTAHNGYTYYCISELELFDTRVNLCQTMTSDVSPAPYACFATSCFGTGTGAEAYLAFDKSLNTTWASSSPPSFPQNLTYYFGGDKYVFTGISFMTNESNLYNPGSLIIQASNDNVTWDNISPTYTFTASDFGCYKYKNLSCKCNKSYRFIRLSILSKLAGPTVEVQIFELKVFGSLKDKCITPPMTSNSAPSPYVASESNAFYDGYGTYSAYRALLRTYSDGSMYSGWTENASTGWMQIYFGGQLCKVTHIDICGRWCSYAYYAYYPSGIEVLGSIDGVNYTTIGSFTGITWEYNEQAKSFPVKVGYWKYLKLSLVNPTIGRLFIYGEYFSNLCATMTSNTTPAPYSCSANSEYSGYPAWKAFNKSNAGDTDGWCSNAQVNGATLGYYFGGISYMIKSILMKAYYTGYTTSTPTDFYIMGSNDGYNYSSISRHTWGTETNRLFQVNASVGYKYIIIYVNANGGYSNVYIGELEIYGRPAKQIVNGYPDITPPMTAASVPENYMPESYTYTSGFDAYKAFDHTSGDSARWKATTYSGTTEGIGITFNNIGYYSGGYAVNRIDITAPITDYLGCPRDFSVTGYTGIIHIKLAEFIGVQWTSGETKTFRFNNDVNYCNYTVWMTASNSTSVLYTISEVYMSREERDNYL